MSDIREKVRQEQQELDFALDEALCSADRDDAISESTDAIMELVERAKADERERLACEIFTGSEGRVFRMDVATWLRGKRGAP